MALNVIITFLICLRLFMMRHRAERVLGKLQATLYNSAITMFVESGGLFTIWSVVYLITRALTRMLIILRMAQDRAWTKDIVTATDTGVLDWQVSSTNSTSIALRNVPNAMCQDDQQKLPRKFREDSISSKSVIHYTAA
ncbi:hypothetical protein NLJ89_g12166 [Agrocybe chaxingu]|uniref:Uncharacterized protein n=1 Tax=Agrocybe chaxingu TaxID=84603 RepID=A0A9W8JMT8_9AGAR|nr:hypothetical protein NLJ89_g12166 [Agrocybe chaxingu]